MRNYLEEIVKRAETINNIPDVLSLAFPKQIEVIRDPSTKKVFWCTRRAAKSYTDGLYL